MKIFKISIFFFDLMKYSVALKRSDVNAGRLVGDSSF